MTTRTTGLRVVVVDDEPSARRRLRDLATELGAEVVGGAANGLEALDLLQRVQTDVVLLDVEMPEVDGLEVARRLSSPRPFIVFATAYDHYATAAFEAEALDFVVKPVSQERLQMSFERARRRMGAAPAPAPISADVVAAVAAAIGRDSRVASPRRILVRHLNGHRLVPIDEVDRFYALDNVVFAVHGTTESIVDNTVDELERRLDGVFVRINRRDLIALDRIDRIVPDGEGAAAVVGRNGSQWRVSRRRVSAVKEALVR
jgi:two-component system response regulator AlgR